MTDPVILSETVDIFPTEDDCTTESPVDIPETPVDFPPEPIRKPKKGRLWPPIVILCLLFTVGLTLFFLIDLSPGQDFNMPWFTVQNGTLYFDKDLYIGSSELTVPSSINGHKITAISNGCFADCQWLSTIYLPEGIKTIGDRAFANCVSMRGLKIPETTHSLGDHAFAGCISLEAVAVPNSVTNIGTKAFLNCHKLHYVFYTGPKAAWSALNVAFTNSMPEVYCSDGQHTIE